MEIVITLTQMQSFSYKSLGLKVLRIYLFDYHSLNTKPISNRGKCYYRVFRIIEELVNIKIQHL